MQTITTSFEILFQAISELEGHEFVDYEEYLQRENILIEDLTSSVNVNAMIKKTSECLSFYLEDDIELGCADKHILFDINDNCIYADALQVGNYIQTKHGKKQILKIENIGKQSVFDIEVNSNQHVYYDANGIKHHNTLVTAAISKAFNNLDYNTITIVPSNDLVNQTFEWYVNCGLDVGKYCGNDKDIYHSNIVSTWQSLQNNPKLLQIADIKTIIWDEAHGAKANVAKEILTTHAKHIPFKYGVTGTMPKSPTDILSLKVAIGNVITTMSARWLMDNGYLTPVEIETFEIKEKAKENFPDYSAEKSYLAKNNDRLDVLADLIINQCEKYGNTLVLVNSIQFGEKLANMIEGAVFLHGGTSNDDRKEHYDMFETEHNLIVIATFGIASTGISIDRVMNLMMIDAGKSFVRAIQSIGRSLRQSDDKDIAHVADVYSSLKWSKKHFKDRVKYYKEAEYPIVGEYSLKV